MDAVHRALSLLAAATAALTLVLVQSASAAFPGVNGKIAFGRGDGNCKKFVGATPAQIKLICVSNIFTMDPTGGNQANVDSGTTNADVDPAYSADGTKIAFARISFPDQIWVMSANGGSQQQLTSATDPSDYPAWSPDGTKIAFSRNNGSNSQIWVMNANGTGQVAITNTSSGDDVDPAWSPDGSTIAFEHRNDSPASNDGIYKVSAGGGTPVAVATSSDTYRSPNWSPSGDRITFDDPEEGQILVVAATGGTPQAITSVGSPREAQAPAFSPDGSKIVFQGFDGTAFQVYVVDATGGTPQNLSNDNSNADEQPDWQPQPGIVSQAQVPACSATGQIPVTVSDPTGFKSGPKAVHFKVDGGAEQVAPTDASGNAAVTVPNGSHTLEYWGEDQAGYQQPTHNTAVVKVDTVLHCGAAPPAPASAVSPKLQIAGLHACVRVTLNLHINASGASPIRLVRVLLNGHQIKRTNKHKFTLRVSRHSLNRRVSHITVIAVNAAGKTTRRRIAVRACKAAVAPRFTG